MSKDRFLQRRTGQGYRSPGERDGCHNCHHRSAQIHAMGEYRNYDCTLGGFFVAPAGICPSHEPRTETCSRT